MTALPSPRPTAELLTGSVVPFARVDLDVDFGRRQLVDPALLGAGPGFLQPIGRGCDRADKILHAARAFAEAGPGRTSAIIAADNVGFMVRGAARRPPKCSLSLR
jgi:hypothetical protein